MSELDDSIFDSDPRELVALMDMDEERDRLWSPGELAAILKHQLSAPVQYDLAGMDRKMAGKLKTLAESQGLVLKSFGDLFQHSNPPLELIRMTKEFAKACGKSPTSAIPRDIADVLYFSCIAIALVRHRKRISKLSNADIRKGLRWVLGREWLDSDTRSLVEQGLKALAGNSKEDDEARN